jgi:4-amino-4-deoxy-L-arabinose transferase-like glycosyltransferase
MPSHLTSIWKRSPNKLRQEDIWLEYVCILGLGLAALFLFLFDLGNLPLLDWDEGIVAQLAKEIYQAGINWQQSLFPTLWGEFYLKGHPLLPNLIAIAYSWGGINEWTTRLPGALLGAASVVLLYKVGREIFVARIPALYSALIYLTLFPVVRQGRLAMSDGPLLCFEILTILAILRARRDLRWALVAGIGLAAMGLTKGIVMLPIGLAAVLFLMWDTPRLLSSVYLWLGIALGTLPLMAWYGIQWYTQRDIWQLPEVIDLVFSPIWAEGGTPQPIWYYPFLLFKYGLPWSLVAIGGIQLAWRNRHWSWAKTLLVWSGVYFVFISLTFDKQLWFILPLYPIVALIGGAMLDRIRNLPSRLDYPRTWMLGFGVMAAFSAGCGLYFGIYHYRDFWLPLIFASLTITLGATTIALARRESQFVFILFWGLYLSILLTVGSSHWLWELHDSYPVKSVASLIKDSVPDKATIYTSFASSRPSLDFYSGHRVIPQDLSKSKQLWQQKIPVYLLVDRNAIEKMSLPPTAIIRDPDTASLGWFLAVKKSQPATSNRD